MTLCQLESGESIWPIARHAQTALSLENKMKTQKLFIKKVRGLLQLHKTESDVEYPNLAQRRRELLIRMILKGYTNENIDCFGNPISSGHFTPLTDNSERDD